MFLAGVAENICAGILPEISSGLGVSIAVAGQLTTVFSGVFAVAALGAAALVARTERRITVLMSLAVFAVADLAAAASPNYLGLLAARVVMAASCAVLVLVASRLAAELAAPEQRGRAIGIVFMGISGSLVLGVPIGMRIAEWAGWRAVFVAIALPVAPLMMWLGRRLPRRQPTAVAEHRSYRTVFTDRRLVAAQLVSILMIGGHFTLFAYLTPYLNAVLRPNPTALQGLYVAFGVAGVTGAWLGGLLSDRLGVARALCVCPAVFLCAMALLPAAGSAPGWFVPAMMLWGAVSWSVSPIVQNYLINAGPAVADTTVAVNVSAMHVGVALGSALGGVLVGAGALRATPWAGCALVAAALVCAVVSVRKPQREWELRQSIR
ncbi:MFS transporter [Nocardia sp. NPDC059240]|uniref:MFS transporter n=1 Tax=Nocardia sp. NPDC059240 TaxID=3346786 RepID=UPI003681902F